MGGNYMKSEWRVTSQCFIGSEKRVYQVYRLRDIHTIDHSGNREHQFDRRGARN